MRSPRATEDRHHTTTGEQPRIAIAAEARYLQQLQPAGLARALAQSGYAPLLLDPERLASAPLQGLDLLIARGRSPAILGLLRRAESMGIRTINRRDAIAAVVDKAAMARALTAARIPTPPTQVGTLRDIAEASGPADFPMLLKPVFGDNARGIRAVRSRAELLELPWNEPAALAQPYLPSDGFDLKLYVAGADVYAALKPSPISHQHGASARAVPMTPALRDLALRCGTLFGLELFGVDCIATPNGPVVIEVNDFPNYSGIEGADQRLAGYAVDQASRARRGSRA